MSSVRCLRNSGKSESLRVMPRTPEQPRSHPVRPFRGGRRGEEAAQGRHFRAGGCGPGTDATKHRCRDRARAAIAAAADSRSVAKTELPAIGESDG